VHSSAELPGASALLLIHGGLAEAMDAERFWVVPGVVGALRASGHTVLAPDRDTAPTGWVAGATDLAALVEEPCAVVAGSNGVSIAVRMAVDHPALVEKLVLLWPATAGSARADSVVPGHARHLLAGETLRGVLDRELAALSVPVFVMASEPENVFHQHATVDRILDLVQNATRLEPGTPESPRPDFAPHLDHLIASVESAL